MRRLPRQWVIRRHYNWVEVKGEKISNTHEYKGVEYWGPGSAGDGISEVEAAISTGLSTAGEIAREGGIYRLGRETKEGRMAQPVRDQGLVRRVIRSYNARTNRVLREHGIDD